MFFQKKVYIFAKKNKAIHPTTKVRGLSCQIIVNPEIWNRSADNEWINKWNEYDDFYISEIFDNLKFIDSFTLKEKE